MSEIKKEMVENLKHMEELIRANKFTVGLAHDFMTRYYNIYRRIEQLEKSRDRWRLECERLTKLINQGKV